MHPKILSHHCKELLYGESSHQLEQQSDISESLRPCEKGSCCQKEISPSFLLGLFRRFGRAKLLQGGCFTGLDRTVAMGLFCWFVSKVVGLLFWTKKKLLQGGCFTGLHRNLQWGCFTGLHRNCYKAVGLLI